MPDALINYHTTDLLPVTYLPCASWHIQGLFYRGGPPLISVSHKLRRSFPPFVTVRLHVVLALSVLLFLSGAHLIATDRGQ